MMGVMLTALFFGCSDDATEPSNLTANNTSAVVRGEIDPNEPTFEVIIKANSADPMVGPFVLRGTIGGYVDTLNALSVDLTIENDGQVSHPLPIGLTFVAFNPTHVTVENPDNDEHGAGAGILFEFANRDDEWTPGEKSLPRTTLFGVDEGESFGFVAQIVIPQDTTAGAIGGIVWNDINKDGVMDNDEPGIGGAVVFLYDGDDSDPDSVSIDDNHRARAETARDGSYRFDDLEAGFYTVIRDFTDDDCFPTTPTVIHVVLAEKDGTVSDFLTANFGCVEEEVPQRPTIEVGDYVKVNGEYVEEGTARLMARSIEVLRCESPSDPDSMLVRAAFDGDDNWDDDEDKCDDDHDWDDCHKNACWGLKNELRGPVTDIDRDNCKVEIMGSWVTIVWCIPAEPDTTPDPELSGGHDGGDRDHPWLDLDDIEIGDDVRVRVMRKLDDDTLYGFWLKEWNGTPDKVYGRVDSVSAPSGPLEAITVLGVNVVITGDTDIYRCDD
jgi:hypothetical protein